MIKIKPKLKNPYGYKVCYKEKGSRVYVIKFLTHSYRQAVDMKILYLRAPPKTDGNKKLKKPTWFVIPIKKSEIRAGIWRNVPF